MRIGSVMTLRVGTLVCQGKYDSILFQSRVDMRHETLKQKGYMEGVEGKSPATAIFGAPERPEAVVVFLLLPTPFSSKLDRYWVGSFDLNFLRKSRGFPLSPHKAKLFAGGSAATKQIPAWLRGLGYWQTVRFSRVNASVLSTGLTSYPERSEV